MSSQTIFFCFKTKEMSIAISETPVHVIKCSFKGSKSLGQPADPGKYNKVTASMHEIVITNVLSQTQLTTISVTKYIVL